MYPYNPVSPYRTDAIPFFCYPERRYLFESPRQIRNEAMACSTDENALISDGIEPILKSCQRRASPTPRRWTMNQTKTRPLHHPDHLLFINGGFQNHSLSFNSVCNSNFNNNVSPMNIGNSYTQWSPFQPSIWLFRLYFDYLKLVGFTKSNLTYLLSL